ncbi:TPA: hypothetical protein DD449_00715 [Candidatus Berkelbacteria bacterium]|uniref:Uncharacterized protein n=1 Tax=Berkelbacteria bacterium GW2011_GWE1_39_12 TaxID=1618337 RepID=A0A0G4B598_9BACT|nr:MAG: hypothetical protein UT28_C0001G0943 [Berkelbacteria bacterium GW2011_GWE1_39_12]HBO60193.1 hypothetical protein [Candidatus Berkelbacteria bacterium]
MRDFWVFVALMVGFWFNLNLALDYTRSGIEIKQEISKRIAEKSELERQNLYFVFTEFLQDPLDAIKGSYIIANKVWIILLVLFYPFVMSFSSYIGSHFPFSNTITGAFLFGMILVIPLFLVDLGLYLLAAAFGLNHNLTAYQTMISERRRRLETQTCYMEDLDFFIRLDHQLDAIISELRTKTVKEEVV